MNHAKHLEPVTRKTNLSECKKLEQPFKNDLINALATVPYMSSYIKLYTPYKPIKETQSIVCTHVITIRLYHPHLLMCIKFNFVPNK